jgi:hypothetical protein
MQWLKEMKPKTKMFAMGCITTIALALIIAAAYSGDLDLLISLFDKVEAEK